VGLLYGATDNTQRRYCSLEGVVCMEKSAHQLFDHVTYIDFGSGLHVACVFICMYLFLNSAEKNESCSCSQVTYLLAILCMCDFLLTLISYVKLYLEKYICFFYASRLLGMNCNVKLCKLHQPANTFVCTIFGFMPTGLLSEQH